MTLPFEDIIDRWKTEIANPLHFASIGPNPRWVPVMVLAGWAWRHHSAGGYRKSWCEYRRRQIANKREAQGKPPSKQRF